MTGEEWETMADTQLVDSHTHLLPPWFSFESLEKIVSEAKNHRVFHIVNSSSDPKSHDFCIQTAERFTEIHASIGLQPTISTLKEFERFKNYILSNKSEILAIGEVGLDYYWVKEEPRREVQRKIFSAIIEFANDIELPLVIHSRKAESDCLKLLAKADVDVYLHSFDGNKVEIEKAVDAGYLIGVPTAVGARRSWKKVAVRTPLENLLLETDAPFLSFRPEIKPNEPKWIHKSAEYIAILKEVEFAEVARATTRNAKEFFKWHSE